MFESNKYFQSFPKLNLNNNHVIETDKKHHISLLNSKSAPKTTRLLLAQLINSFIEYTSELTYFSINAFQTSSLRRVQTTTLTRFDNYCVPRICAFYYSLDREFEEFILRMKKLCKRTQSTFLDIRSARIHYPQSSMSNIPDTHRSLNILKCNIERLRDLKQIHQELGHDLLLPNDQLFLSLDLLVSNFQIILCELDNRVRFRDAIILQIFVKDTFLQFRVLLTWLYPAVKMAAYRIGDPNKQFAVKRCENIDKPTNKTRGSDVITKEFNEKQDFQIDPISTIKTTLDRSQSALRDGSSLFNEHSNEQKQSNEISSFIFIDQFTNDSLSNTDQQIINDLNPNMHETKHGSISRSVRRHDSPTTLSFIKRPSISNRNEKPTEPDLLSDKDKKWYEEKFNEIQQRIHIDSVRIFISHITEINGIQNCFS